MKNQMLFKYFLKKKFKILKIFKSIVDAANITDVFQETYIALKRGPKRNVIVGNFLNLTLKEQKKHGIFF